MGRVSFRLYTFCSTLGWNTGPIVLRSLQLAGMLSGSIGLGKLDLHFCRDALNDLIRLNTTNRECKVHHGPPPPKKSNLLSVLGGLH